MATTINSAGSQMFQRNLAEYNDERNRDDRAQQAEGQRLGRQLTALGLDPDVDDPRLAKLGMAASIAPSGILGTVVKGIAQVKGMDAMQLKADAGKERNERMADMIRSNFEEMSEEDAMMYARNPKAFEQFKSITDYKDSRTDRERRITREDKLIGREDEAYSEKQRIKENHAELAEYYAETFEKIFKVEPHVAKMMASDPKTAHSQMQRIWDTQLDENGKRTLWDQYKEQIIESTGVTSFEQFKVMDEMPVALMNDMVRRSGAKKYIGYNDDLLDQRTRLGNQYASQSQIADAVAIDSMYTDQQARDYAQVKNPRMMVDKSMIPDLKRELHSKYSSGENAKVVTARYDKIVSGQLGGLQKKISRNNQDLLRLHNKWPSLANGPIAIGSAGYLKESLPTYRPGTFFQSNNANFRVVDDGQGNNISIPELEWNDEDKLQFQNRYGLDYGVTGPGASIATPASGSNSLGLPQFGTISDEANAVSAEQAKVKAEEDKVQSFINRIGTDESRAVAKEKEELLSRKDNFQNGVQDLVDLASKETGVSADVFNFDTKTIGDSNQLGTLISNEGKQVNIGGMFESPEDGYTGYMNYKQARGGKNKKLLYSKPILISEFIQKINGTDAESELGLTSKQVKDYKKLINSTNSKSEKLNSLGFEEGNYPDLKNMENMLKPDSAVIDVNPDVEEVTPASNSGGSETKSIEEVVKGIDSLLLDIKKKSNAQEQVRPLDEVVGGLDEYLENLRKGN